MPDDGGIEAFFDGLDRPRPLPPGLAEEITAQLLGADSAHSALEAELRGLDNPRDLPSGLARSVVASIMAAAGREEDVERMRRRMRWLGAAACVLVVAGSLAAATRPVPQARKLERRPASAVPYGPWFDPDPPRSASTVPPPTPERVVALSESDPAYARLESFNSCDELLDWVRPRAEWVTDENGLDTGFAFATEGSAASGAPTGTIDPQPMPIVDPGGRSGTNVQEAGVDEPDMLKVADGSLAFLTRDAMHLIDTSGGGAVLAASVPVRADDTYPASLLLEGSTAVVLSRRFSPHPSTDLRFVEIADPRAPQEREVVSVAGFLSSARVVDGAAHVVTGWSPGPFTFVRPTNFEDRAEVERAATENRRVVRESTIEQWVPPGVACDRVARPRDLSGFSTTLIWSVPIGAPAEATVTGLLADPGSIYASTDRLVIATQRWEYHTVDGSQPVAPTVRTNLHRFALESAGTRYLASGSVPGYLRSSYALSEFEGHLRVASTRARPDIDGATTSTVTVLADDGHGLLTTVGSIEGLGAGQEIVGVRFVGHVGFVVTFLRTDPLYTIDLRDPANPRLRGALEVTGFSGYLHLLGPGTLLGVGVEADEAGRTTGGAVSVYDVSNLDDPSLAQRMVEPSTDYVATTDPHGFLLWEPTQQFVLPAAKQSSATGDDAADAHEPTHSFEVFTLASGSLVHQGSIDHRAHGEHAYQAVAYRAAMVGDVLYTVSSQGVMASDPNTLEERGYAVLPPGTSGW
ncbi:MAG: beta-propeller domain-containing protein [Actinomycetota bacterium]